MGLGLCAHLIGAWGSRLTLGMRQGSARRKAVITAPSLDHIEKLTECDIISPRLQVILG